MAAVVVMSGAAWRSAATRGARAVLSSSSRSSSRAMSGESGDKSGDRAGSVREAGGAFAKREKAEEERYFKKMNTDQLKSLSKHHEEEIKHAEAEIQRLKKEIERHKEKVKGLRKSQEDD